MSVLLTSLGFPFLLLSALWRLFEITEAVAVIFGGDSPCLL